MRLRPNFSYHLSGKSCVPSAMPSNSDKGPYSLSASLIMLLISCEAIPFWRNSLLTNSSPSARFVPLHQGFIPATIPPTISPEGNCATKKRSGCF